MTAFVLWMGFEVCPFRAETFNSYFVVYQSCILPQPWNNIWDRECSIPTGPPVKRNGVRHCSKTHTEKVASVEYKLMLMKVAEILNYLVHHNLCYHYYPDLQLDDRYSMDKNVACHFSQQKTLPPIKPPATQPNLTVRRVQGEKSRISVFDELPELTW